MNQWINIRYKPSWSFDPDYWSIIVRSNGGSHREKSPSIIYSTGNWCWYFQSLLEKEGKDFDWNKP